MTKKDGIHIFRETPATGQEEALQISTARWLALDPAFNFLWPYAFHVPNGGKRPVSYVRSRSGAVRPVPIIGKKMKDAGAKAGVADWVILRPATAGYHGAVIELKVKKGSLQKSQKEFLTRMAAAGYFAAVCYSLDDFCAALNYCYLPFG